MRIKNQLIIILTILSLFCLASFAYIVMSEPLSRQITAKILFYSLGKLMGLIGFFLLSVLIVSGDTARFFDRFFGIDRIIKFQRKFSIIIIIFIVAHPLFFIISSSNYLNYLVPDFTIVPLALGTIAFYIYTIIMISSQIYKKISYNAWQYLHILTYVLFFFGLYHAVYTGSDTDNMIIKSIFGILLLLILVGIIYRTNYKIRQKSFKCHIKEIKWENSDTFTLKLKPNKNISFKAGQFCFLRINKDKLYARHPFTISSAPYENILNFTIKSAGRFTEIASQLKNNEEVIVEGPFGLFTPEEKNNLVFIAGGVGITPFISMIKDQLHSRKEQNIILLYCVKTKENIVFKKELEKIKNNWFRKAYILSQEKTIGKEYEYGHITEEIMKKYIKNIKDSLFYICGPEKMKESAIKILKNLGVKSENIKIESFFW